MMTNENIVHKQKSFFPLAFRSLYDIEDKTLQDWRKENVQAVKGVLNYEKTDAPFAASCLINGVCCISEAISSLLDVKPPSPWSLI